MATWLMKTEPSVYSWNNLVQDGRGVWDGVRNHAAAKNMREMKKGDEVFIYHSHDKEIMGIAKVIQEAYPDPTRTEGNWVAVDITPHIALKTPVSLDTLKRDAICAHMRMIAQSRLSVSPITDREAERIMQYGKKTET